MGLLCFAMWVMRSTHPRLNWNCLGISLWYEKWNRPFWHINVFLPHFGSIYHEELHQTRSEKYIGQDTVLKIKLNLQKRRLFVQPMLRILKRLPRVMNVIKRSYHCHFSWHIICAVMFLLSKSIMVIAALCLLLQDSYRRVVLHIFQSLMHFCFKHCVMSLTFYFSRRRAI